MRLREFLPGEGIDPADAAMANLFPELQGDFGVVVTRDGGAFTFTFSPGQGDMTQRRLGVHVTRWRERSDSKSRYPYDEEIRAALDLLRDEDSQ
jgi:hypothetical protein